MLFCRMHVTLPATWTTSVLSARLELGLMLKEKFLGTPAKEFRIHVSCTD